MDRVALEVVARGEVAHHFKEGGGGQCSRHQVVACRLRVRILRGGGAAVRAFVETLEYVFKLVHARVGKQQGRVVVRHEAGRADDGVAFGFKKFWNFWRSSEGFHNFFNVSQMSCHGKSRKTNGGILPQILFLAMEAAVSGVAGF